MVFWGCNILYSLVIADKISLFFEVYGQIYCSMKYISHYISKVLHCASIHPAYIRPSNHDTMFHKVAWSFTVHSMGCELYFINKNVTFWLGYCNLNTLICFGVSFCIQKNTGMFLLSIINLEVRKPRSFPKIA